MDDYLHQFGRTCDAAYHTVAQQLPQWAQDRPLATAFTLGGIASYGSAWLAQKLTFWLPTPLKKAANVAAGAALIAMPLAYSIFDPETAKQWLQQHPVYCAGLAGLAIGAEARAVQGFLQAKKEADKAGSLEARVRTPEIMWEE